MRNKCAQKYISLSLKKLFPFIQIRKTKRVLIFHQFISSEYELYERHQSTVDLIRNIHIHSIIKKLSAILYESESCTKSFLNQTLLIYIVI